MCKETGKKHLFIYSHGFPESPQLFAKDDIIHQASNFWHLEEINSIFYYSNYIYLALISRNESDYSSNPSTWIFTGVGKNDINSDNL